MKNVSTKTCWYCQTPPGADHGPTCLEAKAVARDIAATPIRADDVTFKIGNVELSPGEFLPFSIQRVPGRTPLLSFGGVNVFDGKVLFPCLRSAELFCANDEDFEKLDLLYQADRSSGGRRPLHPLAAGPKRANLAWIVRTDRPGRVVNFRVMLWTF